MYQPCIDEWNASVPQIPVRDPISNLTVDVSLATYADDVSKILECSDAAGLVTDVHTVNQVFDSCLEHVCMAQNRENRNMCLVSRGAVLMRIIGKYLVKIVCQEELGARPNTWVGVSIIWTTWLRNCRRVNMLPESAGPHLAVFGLEAHCHAEVYVSFFSGMVGSALLSGLEALVLSPSQCQLLDSVLLMYGRKLMRGSACRKTVQEDGSVTYNACRSKQVWEYLRMVPCSIELRVRRLRSLQGLARSPELHCNVLASLFGRFPHDGPDIEAFSVHTNPLDQQCFDDIMPLSELDSGASLLEAMAGDMRRLFTDLRDEFLYVGVCELRTRFFSVSIPPWGWVPEAPSEDDVELPDPPELPYACDCAMADGAVCGARFATLQQLATHVRRTKSGSHGQVPNYYQAVVTNQCPWCRVVHANMRTTRQHVRHALQFKVCKGRGSPYVFQPKIRLPFVARSVRQSLKRWMRCMTMSHSILLGLGSMLIDALAIFSHAVAVRTVDIVGLMDGWARSKPQGGAAPKRQAAGTEALLAKTTLLISKLTLKNELEIRELQSAVFRTLTLSDSSEFVVRMRAATKSFIDESKAARDQGQAPQGKMHVYAWEALTRVAVEAQDAPAEVISVILRSTVTKPLIPRLSAPQSTFAKSRKLMTRALLNCTWLAVRT